MRAAAWNALAAVALVYVAVRSVRFTLWFAAIAVAIAVFLALRAAAGFKKSLGAQDHTPRIR